MPRAAGSLLRRLSWGDALIMRAMTARSGRSARLDALMWIAARGGSFGEVSLLGLLGLVGTRGLRAALRVLLAVGLTQVLVSAIAQVWARPRPFAADPGVHPLVQHDPQHSFPSRHVASAFAMATAARSSSRPVAGLMAGLGGLLAVSRVYCGLHYPSDVLAGAALGSFCGWLVGGRPAPARRERDGARSGRS